ncbi:MAG: hypothetical protein QN423_07580, partial [Nitrososphaeraceae archaeon]|nr:hypothetical protein [Nitrososphaeraceae archaeon]
SNMISILHSTTKIPSHALTISQITRKNAPSTIRIRIGRRNTLKTSIREQALVYGISKNSNYD